MRVLLLLPLLAALPAAAGGQPLSFEEALHRAGAETPALKARRLEVDAKISASTAAGQLPDPQLDVGIENFPISGPPAFTYNGDSMTMARVGISQDVPNLAKRHARADRTRADVTVSEAQALVEERKVLVSTALAWIDLSYANRRLEAIDTLVSRLRSFSSAATSGVASGGARPAQALDSMQAVAELEDKRSEAAADAARARANLARWTGAPEPEATGAIPTFELDEGQLLAAIERNPELAAALARTAQAEADVELARADKRPDWSFDVSYGRRAARYGDMVSAGVTIDLPLFAGKRQDPLIAAGTANAGAARFAQEDTRRSLVADLESALANHLMHHEQWMRSRDILLPLARQRAELETASYSANRASLLDVVQAQAMLAKAELETLDREALVASDAARIALTYGDRP